MGKYIAVFTGCPETQQLPLPKMGSPLTKAMAPRYKSWVELHRQRGQVSTGIAWWSHRYWYPYVSPCFTHMSWCGTNLHPTVSNRIQEPKPPIQQSDHPWSGRCLFRNWKLTGAAQTCHRFWILGSLKNCRPCRHLGLDTLRYLWVVLKFSQLSLVKTTRHPNQAITSNRTSFLLGIMGAASQPWRA